MSKKQKRPLVPVSATIRPETLAAIDQIAETDWRSRAAILRLAIEEFVARRAEGRR